MERVRSSCARLLLPAESWESTSRPMELLSIPPERVIRNLDRYGNNSPASIPSALHEASADSRIEEGALVLVTAAGAGLTSGAAVFQSGLR